MNYKIIFIPPTFSIKFFAINIPNPIPLLFFEYMVLPNLSRISFEKPIPSSDILIDRFFNILLVICY